MPIRRCLGVFLVALAMAFAMFATPARAATEVRPGISVRASDYTPGAGQVFVLRGRYAPGGTVTAGLAVRLQSYAAGKWSDVRGARVATTHLGRYRMRVILSARGVRDLRVVGVPGDGQRRSFHRLVVQVH